jgi:hypothetical protein
MKRLLLFLLVIAVYVLHQDYWYWRAVTPLVFGFLPIGLFYHVCYTLAVSLLMWILVKHAWPKHLEKEPVSPHSNPQSAIRNPQSEDPR